MGWNDTYTSGEKGEHDGECNWSAIPIGNTQGIGVPCACVGKKQCRNGESHVRSPSCALCVGCGGGSGHAKDPLFDVQRSPRLQSNVVMMEAPRDLVAIVESIELPLLRTLQINVAQPFRPGEATDGVVDKHVTPAPTLSPEQPCVRTMAEHTVLVDTLQAELLADDLQPPASSVSWTRETLRCWFEDGGVISLRALACDTVQALELDSELAGIARRRLELLALTDDVRAARPHDHLIGALRREDAAVFRRLANRFGTDGWVACRLGVPPELWRVAREEGARAWPLMRPNHVTDVHGRHKAGRSPSGAVRGDRYIIANTLPGGADAFPMLCALDSLMAAVGAALAPAIAADASCDGAEIIGASHAQVAIFPGDGAEYGAHFDGDGLTTRLTMIVYTSAGWTARDGGEVCVYDERARCWHELPPKEDTILFFRSERVLHKVRPSYAPQRLALTAFLTAARDKHLLATARNPGRHIELHGDLD